MYRRIAEAYSPQLEVVDVCIQAFPNHTCYLKAICTVVNLDISEDLLLLLPLRFI